ncbi:alpha/beta hydrolase [Acinetobacter kookii]|uniref:Pimeloyl-ACP methyl ester carboxylesterase n=1 Tax=Acinetobacter kookii TaxID=1226327 RepID=A0A1G6GL45_9GAMM|nr:alpha/beta hydrolase [Acinetobacter kookii]SDB82731.1 Pimeloyl-ACP methyl ester carboxylesterase [Acinetobacter kookii]
MPHYLMPDNEQLFVREFGQGQPVLVLSGLGMQSWQWLPFLYRHAKTHRFIIPDWRGFGASQGCAIPELDAISSHWRDIDSLIEQLRLNDIVVIAYSMGATTAMHGMQYGNFSEQIAAYLHIDQTPKISVDDSWDYGLFGPQHQLFISILTELSQLLAQHQHIQYIKDLNSQARGQLAKLWLEFIGLQNSNRYSLKAFEWVLNQSRLQSLLLPSHRVDYMAWYINNYLYHQEDYREALQKLQCPVTFLSGTQSRLYPVKGQTLIAESITHAKQVRFEKSGHTPLLSEPLKFAREISAFLKANAAHQP